MTRSYLGSADAKKFGDMLRESSDGKTGSK